MVYFDSDPDCHLLSGKFVLQNKYFQFLKQLLEIRILPSELTIEIAKTNRIAIGLTSIASFW